MAATEPVFPDLSGKKDFPWTGIFLAVVLVTLFWRFLHLGDQSFWLDEIYTAQDTGGPLDFGSVFRKSSVEHQHHPPLYFLILHGFLHLTRLGGEAGLRSLSLIFSLLTIPVILRIGKKTNQPLLASGFLALYHSSHLCLWFSLEARSYSFTFLLCCLLVERFAALPEKPGFRFWILPGLISLALLYTSYFGLFLVPAGYTAYLLGKWPVSRARLGTVLLNGLVLGILYLPLALLVSGQTDTGPALDYIPRPGVSILKESWVYMFRGGSLEYYAFAPVLAAGVFLWKRYGQIGNLPLLLILQAAIFTTGAFAFSLMVKPILHHKYMVYIFLPVLFLVCCHLFLLLPRRVFGPVILFFCIRSLFAYSYFGLPEIYKSPYRQYLHNLSSVRADLPVVTNVGDFAAYYNESSSLKLRFLRTGIPADSAARFLSGGFWEFHMHGPFRFFPDSVPFLRDSLVCLGTARFDVLSSVSLFYPRKNCRNLSLPNIGENPSGQLKDGPWPREGTRSVSQLVFTAASHRQWERETLWVRVRGRLFRLTISPLELFYNLPVPGPGPLLPGELEVWTRKKDAVRTGNFYQIPDGS